uniref:Uncharacterized protein n=1 Tax=Corvus moneduloides TaxID=1196302 RepID=A0A8C3D9B4_CORMO
MARGQLSGGAWGALVLLGLMLPAAPAGAWYKHVASPRYHTVGRASGLLMGVRRSPYLWRRELPAEPPRHPGTPAGDSPPPPGRPAGESPPAAGPAPPPPGPGRLLQRLLRRTGSRLYISFLLCKAGANIQLKSTEAFSCWISP